VQQFDEEMAELEREAARGQTRKPLKRKIENMNMPYYEVIMAGGTTCDLNGEPRITRVNYICYPAGKHEMYSLKESSTCEYDIIVLSPILCKHPDYRPEESSEHEIDCYPATEDVPIKPSDLAALDEESIKSRTSQRMFEGEFMQGDTPGKTGI